IFGGRATFAPINIAKRAFVGNISFLPIGATIGEGTLIGCLTIPPEDNLAAKANTAWLGSPAMFLPNREIFTGFSEKETYKPAASLYLLRALIEFIRIILPTTFVFFTLLGIFYSIDYLLGNFSTFMTFV